MTRLTEQQIKRQDFVDNEVFRLIQRLFPANKQVKWDIEVIGAVRDVIQNEVDKKKVMNKKQFYPFLKI